MRIQKINTTDRIINMVQDNIANVLEPLSSNPLMSGLILTSVVLKTGSNTVNHKLGRKLRGWFIVRQRSAASIYDNQDSNTLNAVSLILVSSANVTVDLYVF